MRLKEGKKDEGLNKFVQEKVLKEVEKDLKPLSRSSGDFHKPPETSATKATTISLQSTAA